MPSRVGTQRAPTPLFATIVESQRRGIQFDGRTIAFALVFSRVRAIQLESHDETEPRIEGREVRRDVTITWTDLSGEEKKQAGTLAATLDVDAGGDLRLLSLTLPVGVLLGQ